jgi:hypothetical protein
MLDMPMRKFLLRFYEWLLNQQLLQFRLGTIWSDFVLKYVNPNSIFSLWFVLPFNGQARRLFCFSTIASLFRPTIGIETGTYYGTSTYLFLGIPTIKKTYTIESDPDSFRTALSRLNKSMADGRLQLIEGESQSIMSEILSGLDPRNERIIAYLDAHWNEDVPTVAEVQSLLDWKGQWIAIIDDFQIPGHEGIGYGYDSYNGKSVNSDLFDRLDGISILVPAEEASLETGARRGTGYFVGGSDRQNLTKSLQQSLPLKLLRS